MLRKCKLSIRIFICISWKINQKFSTYVCPQQDKQLVYAELVLKPAQEKKAAAAAATTPATTATATTPATAAASAISPVDAAAKNATEYAEIVYVQKGEAKKWNTQQMPQWGCATNSNNNNSSSI